MRLPERGRPLVVGLAFAISVMTVLAFGVHAQPTGGIDWSAVEQALGRSGQMMPGDVFRIGMPRSDLKVTVEDVPVQAGFALGSYAAFKGMDNGQALVMGDLVLLDEEVPGVMSGLFSNGFEMTALHNHLNNVSPHVMYLHYMRMGDPAQLASGLHQALSASGTPLVPSPAGPPTSTTLDTGMLESVLGRSGQVMNGGAFQVEAAPASPITMMDMTIPPAMGVTTSINFQPTEGGNAAVTAISSSRATRSTPSRQPCARTGLR